jgi:hypothetical protein
VIELKAEMVDVLLTAIEEVSDDFAAGLVELANERRRLAGLSGDTIAQEKAYWIAHLVQGEMHARTRAAAPAA